MVLRQGGETQVIPARMRKSWRKSSCGISLIAVLAMVIFSSSNVLPFLDGGACGSVEAADADSASFVGKESEGERALRTRGGAVTIEAKHAVNSALREDSAQQITLKQILLKAGKRGLGGGIPGAIAGVVQVLTLMWLRTVINYQSRYGTTLRHALSTLYNDGGIPRFYQGLGFALIQAPLSRFVSTAVNEGMVTLLASLAMTAHWGPGRVTVLSSIVVGLWRMLLMPIDTCKTVLQVDSKEGFQSLMLKVRAGKFYVLYQGALANAISAIVAHYPWFYTYNFLSSSALVDRIVESKLLRHAAIGFASSVVSDSISNCIRVVKTTKQAVASKAHTVTYAEIISMILAADGWKGLFGRGLTTRILANAIQSVVFTVIWRGLAERWERHENDERSLAETNNDMIDDSEPSVE